MIYPRFPKALFRRWGGVSLPTEPLPTAEKVRTHRDNAAKQTRKVENKTPRRLDRSEEWRFCGTRDRPPWGWRGFRSPFLVEGETLETQTGNAPLESKEADLQGSNDRPASGWHALARLVRWQGCPI